VRGGYAPSDVETRFFVLGLAPNAARLAVRFWTCTTVLEMAKNIDQHFQDLAIVHGPHDSGNLGLFRLLCSVAPQDDSRNIPPHLGGEVMRAILQGTPYPITLLQAAVRRIRAERSVTYPRAALIKACLNRLTRWDTHRKEDELTVSLDLGQTNVGYRLGRLFAVLEKIQSEANPGLNTTIRDRFYGAASGSPGSVFPTLIRLSRHHLAKLSTGLRTVRERLIQEIMGALPSQGFPTHLDLGDQGRFAIGYYHQMQALYTKNEPSNKE
jgi:CRISPR-associated protein Csd1